MGCPCRRVGGCGGADGLGDGLGAIDVVKAQLNALGLGVCHQSARDIWRNRLASFVVGDIALRHRQSIGEFLLSDSEQRSDGLDCIHAADYQWR